ncbi:hypothetical protein INR49_018391 [Caranx melampygus]|nr:hypothetical protein INR49_018391 [Caranx melampygus]
MPDAAGSWITCLDLLRLKDRVTLRRFTQRLSLRVRTVWSAPGRQQLSEARCSSVRHGPAQVLAELQSLIVMGTSLGLIHWGWYNLKSSPVLHPPDRTSSPSPASSPTYRGHEASVLAPEELAVGGGRSLSLHPPVHLAAAEDHEERRPLRGGAPTERPGPRTGLTRTWTSTRADQDSGPGPQTLTQTLILESSPLTWTMLNDSPLQGQRAAMLFVFG